MRLFAALDVGGTDIKFAVLDGSADIVFDGRAATPQGRANIAIPEAAASIMESLLARHPGIAGIGVSTAGVVDPGSGEILYAGGTIPEYRGTNWKSALGRRFGLPVSVMNDVNAAALGEWWKGAARGCPHFACITLGTGIGGALFTEGAVMAGPRFRAGEIGHSLYDKDAGTTYEQRASTSALLNRAAAQWPGFKGSGSELFAAARSGDAACGALIDEWAAEVARGIAELMLLFDPLKVLIGGGVSAQGEELLRRIGPHVRSCLPAGFAPAELAVAELGNRAALYGAVHAYYTKETETI